LTSFFPDRPPYRPFLSGPPKFKVGLKKLDAAEWLRPDPELQAGRAHGAAMLDQRFSEVCREIHGSAAAQAEALAMVESALNEAAPETGEPDLARARRMVSDDLVVMTAKDGEWRTAALALCQPTFFSAGHAIGKTLDGLHVPVPDGSPRLAGAIAHVFNSLAADAVFERFNWTIQFGGDRYTPDGGPLRAQAAALGPEAASDQLHLRVERQTIRHLPETGGVLFTIRIALDPLEPVLRNPETGAALAAGWRGAADNARRYKRWGALEAAMEHLLKRENL